MTHKRVITMHKTVFGAAFETAAPGWIGHDHREVGPPRRGYTFMMRQWSFNERSGLPTYLCRVVFEDGSSDSIFVHSMRAAVEYFNSFIRDAEIQIESNKL